jgi:hypothetical protein
MNEAFLSASSDFELQPQQKSQRHGHDIYIFIRSDTLLMSPIDIPCYSTGDKDIHIPSWHTWEGDNGRFDVVGRTAAQTYAIAKPPSGFYKEMVLNQLHSPDANETLHFFEKGSEAGWTGRLGNPEKFLKLCLEANIDSNVTCRPNDWEKLMRVRVGGKLEDRSLWKIRQTNARDFK